MATLDILREALKSRVRLKAPEDESDAVYKVEPTVLDEILLNSAMAHNPAYTSLDLTPIEERSFVLLLAEIEVYFALAAGNSRFFSISAEGAQINKQERVDHYMKLIRGRQQHYDTLWSRFKELNPAQIEVGEMFTRTPYGLTRAWLYAERPLISLGQAQVRSDSVDLEWSTPKPTYGKYSLYISDDLIIDEWESPVWVDGNIVPLSERARQLFWTTDPHRMKFRVKSLLPNTSYKFAVLLVNTLGRWGYSEIAVTTAP